MDTYGLGRLRDFRRTTFWIVGCVAFLSLFWLAWLFIYTAPEFCPNIITFTEQSIDGAPISSDKITLRPGQEFTFSCRGRLNPESGGVKKKFAVIDTKGLPYFIPPDAPPPKIAATEFDPSFNCCFGSPARLGRPAGSLVSPSIKTDSSGDEVQLQRRLRAPTTPGTYQFQILWTDDPDGWIQVGDTSFRQKHERNYAILWQHTVVIQAKR